MLKNHTSELRVNDKVNENILQFSMQLKQFQNKCLRNPGLNRIRNHELAITDAVTKNLNYQALLELANALSHNLHCNWTEESNEFSVYS